MAAWTYDQDLHELLKSEGGYTNNPHDPGGPTNYGITIFDYRMYVKPHATAADVRNMSLDDAKRIYKDKYWNKMRCDDLPAGVDYAVFDFGVNSGISRAAKYLQEIVGADVDGSIGPATLAHVRAYVSNHGGEVKGAEALVDAICEKRLAFLERLSTWSVFGRGWKRRDLKVERIGEQEAEEAPKHHSEAPKAPEKAPEAKPVAPTKLTAPKAPKDTAKPSVSQPASASSWVSVLMAAIAALFGAELARRRTAKKG